MNSRPVEEPLPPLRLGRSLVAVAVGGALGTWIRVLIVGIGSHGKPFSFGWVAYAPLSGAQLRSWTFYIPWWLLVINTAGVFIAAYILCGPLRGRSPDDPIRLLVITGLLGGLTSYSSLFVWLEVIKQVSMIGAAALLIGAIGAGIAAGWLGMKLARS